MERILMLSYELEPLGGGAGVMCNYIMEGLAKEGYAITMISTNFKGLNEFERIRDVEIYRLSSKRKKSHQSNIREIRNWVKHAKQFLDAYLTYNSYSICIANFLIPGGIVARYLQEEYNIPYYIIYHAHDIPIPKISRMYLYHYLNRKKIREICEHSKQNVFMSGDLKKMADTFLGQELASKSMLIPKGMDPENIPFDNIPGHTFRIMFVGRLIRQHDPHTLIRAMRVFNRKDVWAMALLFGDGSMKRKCIELIGEYDLTEYVYMEGKVDREDVITEYMYSAVAVVPSLREGISLAVLEAVMSGCYLITTESEHYKDLIIPGINGDFYPIGDHKKLERLLVNQYHRYMTGYKVPEHLVERYRKKFNIINTQREYHKLTSSILS